MSNTNTDIVTAQPQVIAAVQEISHALLAVVGADILMREDISIPRLTLVQPTGGKNLPDDCIEHIGEWHNSITGEYRKVVTAVLLGIAKQRAAFPRDYSAESELLCGSDDALTPRRQFVGSGVEDAKSGVTHMIDGGPCAECLASQFIADIPPLCTFSYSYALLDLDNGMPFLMRAQRTGIQAGRKLNTVAKLCGRAKSVIISANIVKNDKGKYAVPIFTVGDKLTADVLEMAHSLDAMGNLAARQSVVDDEPEQIKVANTTDEDDGPF
jgi:hypothetical protein